MAGETVPLFITEARVHAVGFRVRQIDLLMRDIQITADKHGLLPLQPLDEGTENIIPLQAIGKPRQFRLRVRCVNRDHVKLGKFGGDHPSLSVMIRAAHADLVTQPWHAAEDAGA